MNEGRILQVGAPLEIYEHPSQVLVAQFLGVNLIQAMRSNTTRQSRNSRRWTGTILFALFSLWAKNILPINLAY